METTAPTAPPAVHLTPDESWALVRCSAVGRLAVVVGGSPDIFPVNHVVDGGSVVFRSAVGTKLAAALSHPVAFEVDGYDTVAGCAWSVVVKGKAVEVQGMYAVLDALTLPLFPWHAAPKPRFLRIVVDSITGRRITVAGGARAAAVV